MHSVYNLAFYNETGLCCFADRGIEVYWSACRCTAFAAMMAREFCYINNLTFWNKMFLLWRTKKINPQLISSLFIPFLLVDNEQTWRIHPFVSINFFVLWLGSSKQGVIFFFALKDFFFLTADYMVLNIVVLVVLLKHRNAQQIMSYPL